MYSTLNCVSRMRLPDRVGQTDYREGGVQSDEGVRIVATMKNPAEIATCQRSNVRWPARPDIRDMSRVGTAGGEKLPTGGRWILAIRPAPDTTALTRASSHSCVRRTVDRVVKETRKDPAIEA